MPCKKALWNALLGIFKPIPIVVLFLIVQSTIAQESNSDLAYSEMCQLLSVINTEVQQQHITPPATQQFYLAAIQGIYSASDMLIPRRFAGEISNLTDEDDFEKLLGDAWQDVKQNNDFDARRASRIAILFAIKSIAPRASFITAEEHRVAQQLSENQYVGIGVTVQQTSDGLVIRKPHIGGPAYRAGLRPGDIVVEVDGRKTAGKAFGKIIDQLRGPKGSRVTVVVRNENETELRTAAMTRNVVPLTTVAGTHQNEDGSWSIAYRPEIAMLKFNSVVGSTAAEFNKLARQVKREGFKGLILDFSNVQSEVDVHHAIMLSDSLIGQANLAELLSVDGNTVIRTRSETSLPDMPLVVIAKGDVSGPLYLVLSALKHHTHAKFAGGRVSSDMVCHRSVELPSGVGVISGMPYAMWKPVTSAPNDAGKKLTPHDSSNTNGDELMIQSRYVIEPDIKTSPERLADEILRVLSDG